MQVRKITPIMYLVSTDNPMFPRKQWLAVICGEHRYVIDSENYEVLHGISIRTEEVLTAVAEYEAYIKS